jgi:hypothetical protein
LELKRRKVKMEGQLMNKEPTKIEHDRTDIEPNPATRTVMPKSSHQNISTQFSTTSRSTFVPPKSYEVSISLGIVFNIFVSATGY